MIAARQDYTPLAWKERMVKLTPNARLLVVEDSRHATPVERPREFNTALKDFLTEASCTDSAN